MDDSQIPPTTPLAPFPARRSRLAWLIAGLGVLVLLQVAALGALLAFPGLRAQIPFFWASPSLPAPPDSPRTAELSALTRPLKIEETFDQPTDRWEQSLARIADGAYEVRVDIPNYDSYGLFLGEKPVRDFDLAIDIQQIAGDPTAEYGIRFRQTGPGDYLMFSISGSGYYRLLQVKNNAYRSLVPWTFDGRIKTEPKAVNRLQVVAQRSSVSASINGAQVVDAKDEIDTGGQLTLGVTTFNKGGIVVRFDNIAGNAEGIDLKEDFSNSETAKWSIGGATIQDGGYEIFAGPGLQSWQQPLPNGSSLVGDFALDVDITFVRGLEEVSAYGVMFGDGGSFDFYTLYLFSDGRIGLFRSIVGGEPMVLASPVELSLVNAGDGATNHVRVEVRGKIISITLNGVALPELENPDPIHGMVGLIVSSGTQARFDNFLLEELQ